MTTLYRTLVEVGADAVRFGDSVHHLVMSVFAESLGSPTPRADNKVLSRVDGGDVLIQSVIRPTRPPSHGRIRSMSPWTVPDLSQEVSIRVRLAAETNTLSGPSFLPAEARKRTDHRPIEPRERRSWAIERLSRCGILFREQPRSVVGDVPFARQRRPPIPYVDLEGVALVSDAEAALAAAVGGVGRGRSYGLGLLDVNPLHDRDDSLS